MNRGYVKVWRKIEDSGLIQLPNTLALFMHLLLRASHKDIKRGTSTGVVEIKRGQYISGIHKLSEALEQTERQIRTSQKRLIDLGIISVKTTNKYTLFTIENYSIYQDSDTQNDKQTTNKEQTNDKETTTKQELNNLSIKAFNKSKSRTSALDYDDYPEFLEFWTAYPNKDSKYKALEIWAKEKPPIQKILNALAWQKESSKWQEKDGRFIPMATTYLNQKRWQDEPTVAFEGVPF